ncbi:hypothetical protein Y1Q_0010120 [Alligator mississippiensis]|uniref:Uncharacterized protein n=1 Tax=Alligator mississippiensis TaxID=8496 RepID=A0A151MGC0_ALLMI|nr:hypothetical protein Y1Q_0010120 [Alligator mississippiensis]
MKLQGHQTDDIRERRCIETIEENAIPFMGKERVRRQSLKFRGHDSLWGGHQEERCPHIQTGNPTGLQGISQLRQTTNRLYPAFTQ